MAQPQSPSLSRRARIALVAAALARVVCAGPAAATDEAGAVSFSGRPGDRLPLALELRDETGAAVRLASLTDRPLLLGFVSFGCGRQCPLVLGGLAEALGRLRLRPGVDYAVATVSIDEDDTPRTAAAAKSNYLKAVGAAYPASAWRFLTGDGAAIRRLTEAVGLRFQREGNHIFQPEVLLAVTTGGAISSVLPVDEARFNGRLLVSFEPAALEQALVAARDGAVRPGRVPEPLYCLPYERDAERSFHRLLTIFAIANLVGIGAVVVWLVVGRRPGAGRVQP